MKRLLLLVCCSAAFAGAADLAGVRNVYLLPMARGFDQFLANRLANEHIFQIVTDPKLADAFLTDRIGESFQEQIENLLPPEKQPAEPAAAKPAAPPKKGEAPEEPAHNIPMTDTVNKLDNPGLHSSFGRARGTVFLVDNKSRQVLWSAFDPPRSTQSKDLDRTAIEIVSRLKKELSPKK